MRYILILLLSSLLTACGQNEVMMSHAARIFLLAFFIILFGIYFISPKIPNILEKLHITELILKNADKITKILCCIGFPLAIFSAIRFMYVDFGSQDVDNILLIIFSITILLDAFCIKKFAQTNDQSWLRRLVYTIYLSILWISAIIVALPMLD